jgi:hypothetical protein
MSLPWPEPNDEPSGLSSSSHTIAIRATVNSIRYRDSSGSGFIAVGIGAGGFSSASGKFDNAAHPLRLVTLVFLPERRASFAAGRRYAFTPCNGMFARWAINGGERRGAKA